MNYLGEEDDLDEYMQLENQILNEDPEQLKQYAKMFKSKTPDVNNFGKNDDLYGDLNALGDFTYQSPNTSSSKKKSKQDPPEIEAYQDFQHNLNHQQQEESSSLNDDDNEILNTKAFGSMIPTKQPPFQSSANAAIPEKEKPKKYQLKIPQQDMQVEPQQSTQSNTQHSSTAATSQQSYNVVQIPNKIKSLLNGKQKKPDSQQQLKPKQQPQPVQQQPQQKQEDQEQISAQLQQLQQQIQNYKTMQNDLKKQKKDLELDYQHLLIEFNKEKEEFTKYRKQEMANLNIQKNINDRNREDRKAKQQKEKEIQKENEDLKQQLQQLKEQQKKQNVTKNNQIEALKQNLENQIQYNNELKQKLEEQDKIIINFKLQHKEGGEKNNAMLQQVSRLQELLGNKELEIKSYQQQVFALQQKNEQLEAENLKLKEQKKSYNNPGYADDGFIKSGVTNTIQQDLKSQIDKKLMEQIHRNKEGGDIFTKSGLAQTTKKGTGKQAMVQERSKSQGILRTRNTSSQLSSQVGNSLGVDRGISPQFQQKLQEEFPELPFLDPDSMFIKFQQDMDEFVNNAKLLEQRQKKDVFEQKFDSGARFLNFSNGTSKLLMPNNVTNIKFENGDLKRVQGSLQVYYYYEVQTLFTQYPDVDGKPLKVYRFANGQTEKHYEDGRKSVYYTDLIVKYVQADGSEVVEYPQ